MTNLPSGTVTFLFTDIEGSTKLAQGHPDRWESLRERHHTILQSVIESHNGHTFQIIGDAFCAAFHTSKDGVGAAVDIQQKLQYEDWGGTPIRVRIGLHTGEAELRTTDEYRGYMTMACVQRVMSVAYGGQILLSNSCADSLHNDLPAEISLRDMKEHRLKGLLNPERLWQVIASDLRQDFPPLQSLTEIPNNLPAQLSTFIGREKEVTTNV
jgi:class 3 adenylate cyclase